MLTQHEIQILDWIYWATCLKMMRLAMKWENGRIHPISNSGRLYHFLISGVVVLETLFTLKQLKYHVGEGNVNLTIMEAVYLLKYFGHFFLRASIRIYKTELIQVINQSLDINSQWGRKFCRKSSVKKSNTRSWIFTFTIIAPGTTIVLITVIRAIMRYQIAVNVCGLNGWYDALEICIFLIHFIFVQAILSIDLIICFQTNFASVYISCYNMKFWLSSICPASKNLEKLDIKSILMHYKGLYILSKDFNTSLGTLMIPACKLYIIVFFMITFFANARLFQFLNILTFMMMFFGVIATLLLLIPISVIMSNLYSTSTQFMQVVIPIISAVSNTEERRYSARILKSCLVIRCQVGNLYHMESKAKLTMLDQMVNGVVFLLVNVHP